jgi:D-glycero-D-manno-heptose 1,7-bisphosphate phosphatase
VICENRPDHAKAWSEFQFLPGALSALRRLAHAPLAILMVTNRAIIRRGIVPASVVEEIHERIAWHIRKAGGPLDAIYYCPHRPDEGCSCRKPQPGLLLQAARDLGLELDRSYLIGDALDAFMDIEAAWAAGCQPLLVRTGRGAIRAERAYLAEILRTEGLNAFRAVSPSALRLEILERFPADHKETLQRYLARGGCLNCHTAALSPGGSLWARAYLWQDGGKVYPDPPGASPGPGFPPRDAPIPLKPMRIRSPSAGRLPRPRPAGWRGSRTKPPGGGISVWSVQHWLEFAEAHDQTELEEARWDPGGFLRPLIVSEAGKAFPGLGWNGGGIPSLSAFYGPSG